MMWCFMAGLFHPACVVSINRLVYDGHDFSREAGTVSRMFIAATVTLAASLSPTLFAQWPRQIVSTVPRTADGKINLDAPTPKTADGKPDLSGVWETVPCRGCGVPVISGLGSAPPQGRAGAPPPPPTPAPNPGANV